MASNRHARVKQLFLAACEQAPERVGAFLDAACGNDPGLRREVESLLAFDAETQAEPHAASPLDQLGGAAPVERSFPLPRIDGYQILRVLGEGGMGEVFEAEQQVPVRRRVALKLIKWGLGSKEVLARFESERQALALMSHPSIAGILDAGQARDGRPYFAMELVQGVPITRYCDSARLTTRERLRLLDQVCQGVQHAHQKGVIHRDLKPSNVLVTLQDGRPVPKIIDFGIAKATARRLTERTMFTERGQWIGTPEYMSPEQAEMSPLDVDTRTDVYSLGVLLYELLVGTQPLALEELRTAGLDEVRRRIREEDPPRPSTRAGRRGAAGRVAARCRGTDPGGLVRQLRGDLDWITMKALEKDRARRYGSPAELAADIARHLHDEPVLAGPPGPRYRVGKFVRRHRLGVAATALVVAALVLGLTLASLGLVRARSAERRAEAEARAAQEVSALLVGIFDGLNPRSGVPHTPSARSVLDRGVEAVRGQLADQPLVRARLLTTLGNAYVGVGLYAEARPLLEEALSVGEGLLGAGDPEVATTLDGLGWLAVFEADYAAARWCFERSLQIRRERLGPDHGDVAVSLENFGVLQMLTGHYVEARELLDRALALDEATVGPNHLRVATLLTHRGILQLFAEEPAPARADLERAVAIMERTLAPDHAALAWGLEHLGRAQLATGRLDEARDSIERAVAIQETEQGPDSLGASGARLELATVLARQGDEERARRLFEQVLAVREHALGPRHRDVAWPLVAAGSSLRSDPALRRSRLRRALGIFEELFGEDHVGVVWSLEGLARIAYESGDYAAARDLYQRALGIRQRIYGPGHRGLGVPSYNLACLAALEGDREDALTWLHKAVANGFGERSGARRILDDPDLASLRGDPEFEAIAGEIRRSLDAGPSARHGG